MIKTLPGKAKQGFWGKVKQLGKVLFYPPWVYKADAQEKNIERQLEVNYHLQHSLQASSQQFQQEIESSRQQFELVKLKAQQLIQKDQQDFDKLLFEERKKLDIELQQRAHELQLKLAFLQWQNTRQTDEYKRILDNHPWRLYPETIREFYNQYQDRSKSVPPLVIISPPEVDYDKFPNVASELPRMEKGLAEALRIYLATHYSKNDPERPTNFVGGAWDTKRIHSETAVMHLFYMLNSVPSLILESEVDGDYLNFHIASWDIGQETYEYNSVLSQFSCKNFLYRAAEACALSWKERKANLLAQGWKLEEIEELELDNQLNLKKLEQSEKLKAAGYEKPQDYKVTSDCIQELLGYLKILHCVAASLAVDDYYLLRYDAPPKLPVLLPDLIKDTPDYEVSDLIEVVVSHYRNLCQALDNQMDYRVPELALDLAAGLAHLADKSWAGEQVDYSIQSWLKLHGVTPPEKTNAIEAIKLALAIEDQGYVEKLQECLAKIGKDEAATQVQELMGAIEKAAFHYNRGITRASQEDYQGAIADYDSAIRLNPNYAEAYYKRGVARATQEDYQGAITDYDSAIRLNPNYAEAYFYRGTARFSQGLQEAISDYNQALKINPNFSEANLSRDFAQSQLEKHQRQAAVITTPSSIMKYQEAKLPDTAPPSRKPDEVELLSEKGVDYTKLCDLLTALKWKEADQETADRMLEAMSKNSWENVEREDLLYFPCADLRTINSLWLKSSNGKFGFSVQKDIWIEVGGTPGNWASNIYEKFCDRNGWRRKGEEYLSYSQLTFNINAPRGHLPAVELKRMGLIQPHALFGLRVAATRLRWLLCTISSLAQRIVTCNI